MIFISTKYLFSYCCGFWIQMRLENQPFCIRSQLGSKYQNHVVNPYNAAMRTQLVYLYVSASVSGYPDHYWQTAGSHWNKGNTIHLGCSSSLNCVSLVVLLYFADQY